jgi:hypothetical protein
MSDLIPFPSSEPERQSNVIAVPFLSGAIPCVRIGDEPMVILKPVSDLLGLNWAGQYAKLSADQTACIEFISIQMPGDDQARKSMVVTLETFAVWLARLQPSRVKASAREVVVTYQREAARALRNHFFGERAEVAAKSTDHLALAESIIAAIREDRQRIAAVEAKVSAIEGRHDWFTALGYAKLTDRPTDRPYLIKVGTRAGRILREGGEQPVKRQDATFGSVNTYPADVLEQAFQAVKR